MNLSAITNFSWSGSWDWIIVVVFLAVAFIYGLSMGRNRLVVVILGTYFSFLLTKYLPWNQMAFTGLKDSPSSTVQIFVFLAIILGFYFAIPHSALGSALKLRGRGKSRWWQSYLLSILQVGLILAVVVGFLPTKIVENLSSFAKLIFVGSLAQFLWLFLPILAIMFLRRGRREIEE